jgi:hypothetical protein
MKSCLRLSQGQLNLLETCPPQFQKIYLEQLASPSNPEQEEKKQWGTLFHLLMQQLELGLPIDSLLAQNPELQHSLKALVASTSEIWPSERVIWREAEHYRTLTYQGYLLTVVYDLLVTYENKAVIFDWKTYLQPENPDKLAKNWQTRLYLYVLAETSNYRPENISLTYWFVKLPTEPQRITFNYNLQLHQQTHQDLSKILNTLERWLKEYIDDSLDFPHRSNCENTCPYYQSLLAFEDNKQSLKSLNNLTSIEDIEEICLE